MEPSPPPLVVTDPSELIDGVAGRQLRFSSLPSPGEGVRHRSRSHDNAAAASYGAGTFHRSAAEEENPINGGEQRPSDSGGASSLWSSAARPRSVLSVPPRRTVSTAAWQRCQLPVHIKPTAPFTGLIVRPHASNSKDLNKAATK